MVISKKEKKRINYVTVFKVKSDVLSISTMITTASFETFRQKHIQDCFRVKQF